MVTGFSRGWRDRGSVMDRSGNGIYISGGALALIIIIILLIWIF